MRLVFFIIVLIAFDIQAQVSSNGTASVDVIRPLSIQAVNPNLDFGDIILTGTQFSVSIEPLNGAEFQITGNPSWNVTITFSPVSLDNTQWVSLYGGTTGQIEFTPNVIKEDGSNIISGNSYQLPGSLGILNIYLGGSIEIAANQPNGDYSGTFVVNVSY